MRFRWALLWLLAAPFGCGTRSALLWDTSEPVPSESGGAPSEPGAGGRGLGGTALGGAAAGGGAPGGGVFGVGGDETASGGAPSCVQEGNCPVEVRAPNADQGDRFGFSVAISGDTLAVGASWEAAGGGLDPEDNSVSESGAVYVFVRRGNEWSQEAYLKAPNPDPGDWFGRRIALDGDTLVVGAYGEDSDGSDPSDNSVTNSGAAYVFVRRDQSWVHEAYLKSRDPTPTAWFGRRVAVAGDRIAVGAYGDDRWGQNTGSVTVFERTDGEWKETAELFASPATEGAQFGSSVTFTEKSLFVAAIGESSGTGDPFDGSAPRAGAVYEFRRTEMGYAQTAYIKASAPDAGDWFGVSLAADERFLVVGAYGDNSASSDPRTSPGAFARGSGAAYVFERHGDTFVEVQKLKPQNADPGDNFGSSVALGPARIAVGAFGDDSGHPERPGDNSAPNSGATYLFEQRRSGSFFETTRLKAPNVSSGDRFGWAIASTPTTLIVGAFGASGSPRNPDSTGAGAVHIFPW